MEATATDNKLLVIWQDNKTRLKHIVGELSRGKKFKFCYSKKNIKELKSIGFNNLTAFPDLEKKYSSDSLFSAFSSRLPDKRRSDIGEILSKYNMNCYDEFDLLRKSGGRLPTDSLEFVEPIDLADKFIQRQFYIAGIKYYRDKDDTNILSIKPSMMLSYHPEPENKLDSNAVQVLNQGKVIGYIPSYFSNEVAEAIRGGRKVKIVVVEVKPNNDENWHERVKAELTIE